MNSINSIRKEEKKEFGKSFWFPRWDCWEQDTSVVAAVGDFRSGKFQNSGISQEI